METRIAVLLAIIFITPLTASSAGAAGERAALGERCGGILALQCENGLLCEYTRPGQCGDPPAERGTCISIPTTCPAQDGRVRQSQPRRKASQPVCGCDGKTYSSDCKRQMGKTQLQRLGKC